MPRSKPTERVSHPRKTKATDLAVDALVLAGVTAPLWVSSGTGYSAIGGVAAMGQAGANRGQLSQDVIYNLKGNLRESVPAAALLIGTGVGVKKAVSYLRKRGMLRGFL